MHETDQIGRSARRRTQKVGPPRSDVLFHFVHVYYLARHQRRFDGHRSKKWSRSHPVY